MRTDEEAPALASSGAESTLEAVQQALDQMAAAGGCTDGCHATSAAAASTASEATRPTRWIGVGLAFGHEVHEDMTFSPMKLDEILDLHLG